MRPLILRDSHRFPALVLFAIVLVSVSSAASFSSPSETSYDPVYSWSGAASMQTPRAFPEVVVLDDGRVLVTGGLGEYGPIASTEVYDPEYDTWRAGPSMISKRVGHTATLLADGTVLVTGGETGKGTTASAEVLDVSAGSTTPVGSMYFERSGHEALLLDDGRVLIVGGSDWISDPWYQVEAYDPETHGFVPAGSMASERVFLSLEKLAGGRVLAIGGDAAGTSEVFDPEDDTWSDQRIMLSARYSAAVATASDGRIIIAGGVLGSATLSSCEAYDESTGAWSAMPDMTVPRAYFSISRLPTGDIVAAGSWSDLGTLDMSEMLDPSGSDWSEGPDMAGYRGAHGCAVLDDGTVMVVGGFAPDGVLASAEILTWEYELPELCLPKDIIPLVMQVAPELQGHSENGFVAQLEAAQAEYDLGDIVECLEIMDAFYHHVKAFWRSGHMSDASATLLYDGYARVVACLGGTPLPGFP